MATWEDIQKLYPPLALLYGNIPELKDLLLWTVTAGDSPEVIQAAIQNSNYYRTRTDKQRNWDATVATDPAEATRLMAQALDATQKNAVRLGMSLSHDQLVWYSTRAATEGWTGQELTDALVGEAAKAPDAATRPGEFGAAMTKVRSLANDYALPVDPKEVVGFATQLLSKSNADATSEDALKNIFASRAASLYPTLKPELDAGVSVTQWAQPYKALAAQELEISPDSITFNDPKWRKMLEASTTTTAGGKTTSRPMTLSEWQATYRQDPTYGFAHTSTARDSATKLETGLLQKFGAMG